MVTAFEVVSTDIESLDAHQLTTLLHDLLIFEAAELGLPKAHVSVGLNIDIPDGGEDGLLEWAGPPDPSLSNWLAAHSNLLQAKATIMGPAKCAEEMVDADGNLKPRIQRVVDAGGAYILFYGRRCTGQMITEREDAIRSRVLASVGEEKARQLTIRVYGAEKIAEWTGQYAPAIVYVLRCLGRSLPVSFQRWTDWKGEWDAAHPDPLVFHHPGSRLALDSLRTHLDQDGSVARLVGLSGLGKSRLALETFAPPADTATSPRQLALSKQCIYVKDGADREREVVDALRELKARRVRAIVVVDECPLALHDKLAPVVSTSGSLLSLLTLDFEPDSEPRSRHCRFIRLMYLSNAETDELLRSTHPHLSPDIASRIVSFARGFPRMVEFLAAAAATTEPRLWDLGPRDVFKNHVVRRAENKEELYAVAKALALFAQVAIYGDYAEQLNVIASEFCGGLAPSDVHTHIRNLERAGIVYRRGDYVRVTPPPLAWWLASEWWDDCHEAKAGAILSGTVVPQEMVDALLDHLRRLAGHAAIERMVNKILGADSPFVAREQINSASGSRLMSSLAEVHPKATCRALTRALAHLSIAEAKQIDEGRRNLVWAAQKLAWWRETFAEAAWLLLLFGAAENETWGNNATAEFKKLFHLHLAGTQQPAFQRLAVIERGLRSGIPEIEHLSVEALVSAFRASDFGRTGGVESQGLGMPSEDWRPSTWNEVWEYWRAASQLIEPYLTRADSLGATVRDGLARRARGVVRAGGLEILEHVIARVRSAGLPWPEMLGSFREAQKYEKSQLSPATLERLKIVEEQLAPTSLRERLHHIVSLPDWGEIDETAGGGVTLMAETRAKDLGHELAAVGSAIVDHFPALLRGEQRQAFVFGEALGSASTSPLELLRRGSQAWLDVPVDVRNSALLMGLCRAASQRDHGATHAYAREQLGEESLRHLALDLIRAAGPEEVDISAVSTQIRNGSLQSRRMLPFTLGRALERIPEGTLTEFLEACRDRDPEGARVALELLGMRVFREQIPDGLRPITMSLLVDRRLLTRTSISNTTSDLHYKTLAEAVLGWGVDANYIRQLTAFVLQACQSDAFEDRTVQEILVRLLKSYPELAWQEMKGAIEDEDWANATLIRLVVGGFDKSHVDLVSLVGMPELLRWCAAERRAAPLVASMTDPIGDASTNAPFGRWSQIALELLDHHGTNADLLQNLSARIHSGTWSGSAIPRLEKHLAAFEQLLVHPSPAVVKWAAEEVTSLHARIEREKKREEEREFGVHR